MGRANPIAKSLTRAQVAAAIATPDSAIREAVDFATVNPSPRSGPDADRAHPVLSKPLDGPIVAFGDQTANSFYWPWMVKGPDGRCWLFWSTDHEETNASSGIWAASADSPLGPFTHHGKVFRDTTANTFQTETPSVVRDPATGTYLMYYQIGGSASGVGEQSTWVVTSTDLLTWGNRSVAVQMTALTDPGVGHAGYFRPFRIHGRWYGVSLYGSGRYAFWSSPDGRVWSFVQTVGHQRGWLQGIAGNEGENWMAKRTRGDVLLWRGEPWWVGPVGPTESGGQVVASGAFAVPLSTDFRRFRNRPIDVTPPAQAWENGGISDFGNAIAWEGRVFMPYRANSKTIGLGVMEVS